MKPIYVLFVTFVCIVVAAEKELECKFVPPTVTLSDKKTDCTIQLYSQIEKEMNASLTYLSMGVHFAKDTNHRPGFSKFFFEAANEEREHAIKIIEYYLMRGELIDNEIPKPSTQVIVGRKSGVDALNDALTLEKSVTENIREIIETCEKDKNYHLVDYLTTVFLDEQYKGQRDLAGKIATLEKMKGTYGILGEFLFDKKLLNGEV